ncbi:MAG: ABC transporter substrate-binding protein [Desulfovibrio sp.]|jgi:NitT/TauT family transport system substrate-binding protein|nr:ABC transporter substrate-binding protein [Desulfovibrio sp.]
MIFPPAFGRPFRGLLSALSLACALAAPAGAASSALRLAYLQNDLHHLALWVGMEKGFFAQEGLRVEIAGIFRSGPEMMTAFGAGALDAAYVGEAPAAIAAVRGTARIRILAQANTEGSSLVWSEKPPAGRRQALIAVPGAGGVQDLLLRKALPLLGLEAKDVEVLVLSPPEMLSALAVGEIDAFVAWEPYPAKAVATGIGRAAASSSRIWPGHLCCALVITEKLAKERPGDVRTLLRVHRRATRFLAENREESVAIAVRWTGMEASVIRRAMDNVIYTDEPDIPGLEAYLSFLRDLGIIALDDLPGFARALVAWEFQDRGGR